MQPRSFWIPATSGVALVFIATLAYAIHLTRGQASASTILAGVVGAVVVNVGVWTLSWLALRAKSREIFHQWLLGLGDLLLPVTLYILAFATLGPIKGNIPLSASFACMAAVAYYIFAHLLTGRAIHAYLLLSCAAVTLHITQFTAGQSLNTIVLMLAGLVGLGTLIGGLIHPPLRRHYAIATLALACIIVGRFWPVFVTAPNGWFLLAVCLIGVALLSTTWLNRDSKLGHLLAVGAGGALTLSLAAVLYYLGALEKTALVALAVWTVMLIILWFLLNQEKFSPFNKAAYFLALIAGSIALFLPRPLWQDLAKAHFMFPLAKRLGGAAAAEITLTGGGLFDVLTLLLIAVAWAAAAALRQSDQPPAPWPIPRVLARCADFLTAYLPPMLVLAVWTALTIMVFQQASSVVVTLIVLGVIYCLAAQRLGQHYLTWSLRVAGYIALVLASIVSLYNLTWAVCTVTGLIVLFFILAEANRSVVAYIIFLIYLITEPLLIAFKVFPGLAALCLVGFYALLVGLTHWWITRTRSEDLRRDIPIKTQMTLSIAVLAAAVTLGSGAYLRQFNPITFLIIALSFVVFRYAWEAPLQLHFRRYARVALLTGCYLTHIAIGLLAFSLLRRFHVRLDYYGLSFALLSVFYLLAHRALPNTSRAFSRATIMHFTHYLTALALVLTIGFCPLGVKAVLTWLLVIVTHLSLSAREETGNVYPLRVFKVLGAAAMSLALINLAWRMIPAMSERLPLPDVLTRSYSMLFTVSFLFALALIFTVLMNREKSVIKGAVSLALVPTAIGLVAFKATSGYAAVHAGLLYVYLLMVSRVAMRRTIEKDFSPLLPQLSLWAANILLVLSLATLALRRDFQPVPLAMISVGYMVLSIGWEKMLPAYARQRLRATLLMSYYLAHIALGVTLLALLRFYNVRLSGYSLAYAGLAGVYLLIYRLMTKRRGNELQEKVLWHFTHYFSVASITLMLGFGLRSLLGGLTGLLLSFISVGVRLISGRAIYEHLAALLAIGAVEIAGRARAIQLVEYYLIPPGLYVGWVLYRWTQQETISDSTIHKALKFTFALAVLLLLVAYPAWRFARAFELIHLIFLGAGALSVIYLFRMVQISSTVVYTIYGVLIAEAIYIMFWGRPTLATLSIFAVIGLLIIGDLRVSSPRSTISDQPPEPVISEPWTADNEESIATDHQSLDRTV